MLRSELSHKGSPHADFEIIPDREVEFMGVPYPGSKLVNGVWYRRTIKIAAERGSD